MKVYMAINAPGTAVVDEAHYVCICQMRHGVGNIGGWNHGEFRMPG